MALRRMVSRYNGRCKRCKAPFSAGSEIYWSKPTGALCIACGTSEQGSKQEQRATTTEAKQGKPQKTETKPAKNPGLPEVRQSGRDSFFTIEWSQLKEIVREALESGNVPAAKRAGNRRHVLRDTREVSSWQGYTPNQLKRWVSEGYDTDAIRGLGEFNPPLREKRKYQYVEDGEEIVIDRALSGDDTYMAKWTERESIPGVAIEAEIMFASSVSADVVNAYNVFICRSLLTLESEGIDCQVTLKFSSDQAADDGAFLHSIVRVKKENEATDFRSFSAMLSPAALRTFGFVSLILHADQRGRDASHSLGRGNRTSREWLVRWNPERRVLEFNAPYVPSERKFPEEHMQRELREALHAMKTNN